jgi:integrase
MASLQQEPTGVWHVVVRIEGKRYKRSLGTKIESEANCRRDEIQETIDLVKRNRIRVPEGVKAIDFVLANGELEKVKKVNPSTPSPQSPTLNKLFHSFFESLPPNSIEENTIATMRIHERHLTRLLKGNFLVQELDGSVLQRYVNKRSSEKTQYLVDRTQSEIKCRKRRTNVSATTIKKEIVTLGAVWRWAMANSLLVGDFPNRGLRYPKVDEKPPFQTMSEIARQIEQDGLSGSENRLLWDCLYLRKQELDQLLKFVKDNANHEFIYPMFVMAAHTGARRSEILRAQCSDFDIENLVITIREKKRVKGRRSTRRVPMTPLLRNALSEWLSNSHPGGQAAFAQAKSQKRSGPTPITPDQAQCHFRQTVRGSQWERIKGWHCLRHSFISNLACSGVDQRIIDEFVGHTTEDMRRRYRHLFPNVKHAALNSVFA